MTKQFIVPCLVAMTLVSGCTTSTTANDGNHYVTNRIANKFTRMTQNLRSDPPHNYANTPNTTVANAKPTPATQPVKPAIAEAKPTPQPTLTEQVDNDPNGVNANNTVLADNTPPVQPVESKPVENKHAETKHVVNHTAAASAQKDKSLLHYFTADSEPKKHTKTAAKSHTINNDHLKVVWKGHSGKGFKEKFAQFQPAYSGDAIYIADSSGSVQSYRLDGKVNWKVKAANELSAGVGVSSGVVTVATYQGDVIALNELDGRVAWRKSVGSEILAAPAVSQGVVVIHSSDERVIALDAQTGNDLWAYDGSTPTLSLRGERQPMIQDGYVIIGLSNGRVIVFQLHTGKKMWEYAVAYPKGRNELQRVVDVNGLMAIDNNTLYATAYHGKLVAVQMQNSTPIWEYDVSSMNGVSVGEHGVYVSDDTGVVWAFDKHTGKVLWKQEELAGMEPSVPAVTAAGLAIGDNAGNMNLLSPKDGQIISTVKIDKNAIMSAPLLVKDQFVVYTQGGTLAALAVK